MTVSVALDESPAAVPPTLDLSSIHMRKLAIVIWPGLWLVAIGGIGASILLALAKGGGIIVALTLASSIIAAVAASAGTFIHGGEIRRPYASRGRWRLTSAVSRS